jgi:hypothetical protein
MKITGPVQWPSRGPQRAPNIGARYAKRGFTAQQRREQEYAMNAAHPHPTGTLAHQLCFKSLHHAGRALSFPCDAAGEVAINALSERGRNNYLFARAVVGRDYCVPVVIPSQ